MDLRSCALVNLRHLLLLKTVFVALTKPKILTHAGSLLERYKVLLCDVWGVVHNGAKAHEDACAALVKFRDRGGTVILVSNAPVPKFRVQAMLDRIGVPRGIADDIISSGELALRHIREIGYKQVYFIGPEDRDAAFFEQSSAKGVALEPAEAVVCTGLNDDRTETAENYKTILKAALDRDLPFVCANPDLVVDVDGTRFFCAGAIADLYEKMGGEVYWAGKPHASAYDSALKTAQHLRKDAVKKSEALVIGDAVRTDIEGARRSGHDALFIAGGIHRNDIVVEGVIVPDSLVRLFATEAPPALAAMIELAW